MKLEKAIGWDKGSLESLLEYYIGGDWGKNPEHQDEGMDLAYCIRGSEIRNWAEDKGKTASLRKIKKNNITKRKLIEGDILVEISGGGPEQPVGRTILIDKAALSFEPETPKICTNFLRLIRPLKTINSKYLNLYLQLFYSSGEIVNFQNGSNNLRNLKFPEFLKITIPFPIIKEQLLIVEKIEELFSELDKGIENLKTAQQQLKVYRQSVLKRAFEGKLTNYNIKDGELPEGWAELPMGTVIEKPTYGTSKKCDYPPIGRGVLRIPNIINGIVNASDLKFAEFDKSEINAYNLKDGDLLIIRSNGSVSIVGKCALITKKEENYLYAGYLIRLRPIKKLVNPKYLSYILSSSNLRNQIEDKAKSTSGVNNINANELKELIITVCSIEDQNKVVQEIESRLSVCDKIEETITNSLQQGEALRQSILKKAFEGKLVNAKVQPLYKPKNTYFYQMQLLGIVAAASKDKGINHGEMTIAKYAYLLDKVYQIPTYYEYKRWHLGPYPPEIKKAINNSKFFTKKDNAIAVNDIDSLTKYINPYTHKLNNAVNDLSEIFLVYSGKERSHQIELLATVCKVIEDIQSTDLKAVRESMAEWKIDLVTTHFKNKAEKFSEKETLDCIKLIIGKGWELNLMKQDGSV